VIETVRLLAGNFSVLDLGSADAADWDFGALDRAITMIEIDALTPSKRDARKYYRIHRIQKAVAGEFGKRKFYRRKFAQASSFLEPNPDLTRAYGLEEYFFAAEGWTEMECETLPSVLAQAGLERVDFIKTDLEGLDFEVLSSSPAIVREALALQSELRFQPFYLGEPFFHTFVSYLAELGFELITIRPVAWKYATPNSRLSRDGRLVIANTIFFLCPAQVETVFGKDAWLAFAKQIILAKVLGLDNYAEYIFELAKSNLPATIQDELGLYISPRGAERLLYRAANLCCSIRGGSRGLLEMRRMLLFLAKVTTTYGKHKHVGWF
jgi:hypothetical protein